MRFGRSSLSTLALLALGATMVPGCEGCEDAPAVEDAGPNPLDPYAGDAGPKEPEKDPRRWLTFEGNSPLEVYFGAQQQLTFKLVDVDNAPVPTVPVNLQVTGNAGTLSATQITTDARGLARVTFTAGMSAGDVTITADAEDAEQPAVVSIQVRVNPYGNLNITVRSSTRIPTARAEVMVWRGTSDVVPSCAAVQGTVDTGTALPAETFSAEYTAFPSQRSFSQQPQGTVVTAYAVGYNQNGVAIAKACQDELSIIGGQTTSTNLVLVQDPTVLEGDYDVRLQVDLGNALPEPYEGYVGTVSNILADPAGYAVYQLLRRVDEDQGYTFVTWDPDMDGVFETATYETVAENETTFNTWRIARDIVDTQLRTSFPGRYDNLTTVGGDIRNALTEFEVGSRYVLAPIPNTESAYNINEQWNDLVFEWRYGCPSNDDLACARRLIEIEDTTYTPLASEYGASAVHEPSETESERFAINTEPHLFSLRYGAVVMIAMNELVFPSLSNGEATNLEEYLNYLIDCGQVATGVYGAIPGILQGFLTEQTLEGLCGFGLTAAANGAEGRVLEAQVGGGDPQLDAKEQQGALGGGTFYIEDRNHDIVGDTVVDLELQVQWNDPEDESGPSADILAPIIGEGRRMATGCVSDSSCPVNQFCLPMPHYMLVQAVEMTCESPVGRTQGEEACNADSECTTGVCVGEAQGVAGTCFSACNEETVCGAGTCVVDGATFDLESSLTGLGSVTLGSCL